MDEKKLQAIVNRRPKEDTSICLLRKEFEASWLVVPMYWIKSKVAEESSWNIATTPRVAGSSIFRRSHVSMPGRATKILYSHGTKFTSCDHEELRKEHVTLQISLQTETLHIREESKRKSKLYMGYLKYTNIQLKCWSGEKSSRVAKTSALCGFYEQ